MIPFVVTVRSRRRLKPLGRGVAWCSGTVVGAFHLEGGIGDAVTPGCQLPEGTEVDVLMDASTCLNLSLSSGGTPEQSQQRGASAARLASFTCEAREAGCNRRGDDAARTQHCWDPLLRCSSVSHATLACAWITCQ